MLSEEEDDDLRYLEEFRRREMYGTNSMNNNPRRTSMLFPLPPSLLTYPPNTPFLTIKRNLCSNHVVDGGDHREGRGGGGKFLMLVNVHKEDEFVCQTFVRDILSPSTSLSSQWISANLTYIHVSFLC